MVSGLRFLDKVNDSFINDPLLSPRNGERYDHCLSLGDHPLC